MFHLPHNAVKPEEVEFIISLIDENKEYYLYDELKAMMFEEEVKQGCFEIFHKGMYKKFMNSSEFNALYEKVKECELSYKDLKKIPFSPQKDFNRNWNEIVRDYFEFIAFTGLMPSYYKGQSRESDKRYYIGNTLKQFKRGEITYQDILFKMKHRNASKDFSSFTKQYDIRNRPFVVALKVLDMFKQKGFKSIDGKSIIYYVIDTKNEDDLNKRDVKPINKNDFSKSDYKEIGRYTTFMRQHLTRKLNVKDLASSPKRPCVFDLTTFDINSYNFKDKAVFIGDVFEGKTKNIELTPYILKCISNPSAIVDKELKEDLKELGLIDDTKPLCDFNPDTDLMSRELVELFFNEPVSIPENQVSERVEVTTEYREGKEISSSSDGSAYEKFLYHMLKNKFGEKSVKWYGSHTTAQRLSDIVCDVTVKDIDGTDNSIKIIVEAKAGAAISAFDERKEIDDIANTLGQENTDKCNGIWYIVVDSDKIPLVNQHGGFRRGANQKSFKDKLIFIHQSILSQMWKPTLVTAFSYDEFMKFLYKINYEKGFVTRMRTPNFWMWSKNFIQDSYVSVIA